MHDHLRPFVLALDEAVMAAMPLLFDELEGRPEAVPERAPDGKVVIDRPRVSRT
jgi:hypothetical protein